MSDRSVDVRRMLEAFWASNWETAMAVFADDAIYEDPLLKEPARGKEAILGVFKYCHHWGRLEGEVRSCFGGEHFAVAELRIRGTMIAPAEGMPDEVVGRRFDFVEADVFEFDAAGKIARETIYPDVQTFLQQIGLQQSGPGSTGAV